MTDNIIGSVTFESQQGLDAAAQVSEFVRIEQLTEQSLPFMVGGLVHLSTICWTEIGSCPWGMRSFIAQYPYKFQLSFYAETDNQVIGCLIATFKEEPFFPSQGRVAYIHKLAVLPDYRNSKVFSEHHHVGYAMIQQLFEQAQGLGFTEVQLSVDSMNVRAIRFYQKIGFHSIGHRSNHEEKQMTVMSYSLI